MICVYMGSSMYSVGIFCVCLVLVYDVYVCLCIEMKIWCSHICVISKIDPQQSILCCDWQTKLLSCPYGLYGSGHSRFYSWKSIDIF